jgi:6-phosphofructokinase 1
MLGILVGGGPAPGINSAISSITIEARNAGLTVVGIYDGFEHLIEAAPTQSAGWTPPMSCIHLLEVDLRPARQPDATRETDRAVEAPKRMSVGYPDLARPASTALSAAHVPRPSTTPPPRRHNSAETARHVGTELASTMMRTSPPTAGS